MMFMPGIKVFTGLYYPQKQKVHVDPMEWRLKCTTGFGKKGEGGGGGAKRDILSNESMKINMCYIY